ncbi:MAG TPA: type II secretion system F family protein [Sphingomonas sp.]|nr:type II secretion system F family protein [Sphingomonas sp.]
MLPVILLLVGGAGLLALGLRFGSPGGRSNKRRLQGLKARHSENGLAETQLRRIDALRTNRLDDALHRFVPNPELLRKRLEATGRDWTLGKYALFCAALSFIMFVLLLIKGLPFLLALFGAILIGVGLPHMIVGKMVKRRIKKFLARFPDAIELLVRGLRSGLPISETMSVVASEVPDPVGGEFRGVTDRMRIGRTMEQALQESADKLNTPEFQFFVITLAIQRETGGNLAETLGNLSDVLRKRMQMKLKINAMSSESKASAYIIGSLPFIVFGLIYWINPTYMGTFFTDQRLMITAACGGVWMAIGAFIMAKMINFEV